MIDNIKKNAKETIQEIDQQIAFKMKEIKQLKALKRAMVLAINSQDEAPEAPHNSHYIPQERRKASKRTANNNNRTIAEVLAEVMSKVKGPVKLKDLEALLVDSGYVFTGAMPRQSIYSAMSNRPDLFTHNPNVGWTLKAKAQTIIAKKKKGMDIDA
jgi:hypothetical protein